MDLYGLIPNSNIETNKLKYYHNSNLKKYYYQKILLSNNIIHIKKNIIYYIFFNMNYNPTIVAVHIGVVELILNIAKLLKSEISVFK